MGLPQYIKSKTIRCIRFPDSKFSSCYTPSTSSLGTYLLPNGLDLDFKNKAPTWYDAWIISQSTKLPSHIFNIFHANHEHCTAESHWGLFTRTFLRVAESAIQNSSITIDGIIGNLFDEGILAAETSENINYARYFIFTLLGYQTMLYSPSPLNSTPETPHQLRTTEDRGCCKYTHASLAQDMKVCTREPLSGLLMGFGVFLPSSNLFLDDDQGLNRVFQEQVEVEAKTFNAYALRYIAGIKVKWTDALACHLEFNSVTKEVLLFRFPSFCQFSLANYKQGKGRGVLHACATTSRLLREWATEEEINHFLLEVLLSYRLLFGQSKKSRLLFRSIDPFLHSIGDKKMRDPLLLSLCGTRTWNPFLLDLQGEWDLMQKETYYLPHDFQILRYRIVILQRHLSTTTPRTWLQLWRDKRNSANWMTFWAVIAFGAFGSLMALLQVILQAIQLVA